MGGKSKHSQRTKNNVRPSSSGRSAELLGNLNGDFNLLTLSAAGGQSALFPTLTTISFEHGLSPEFLICVKKLNKKDPITKSKALQELCDLVITNKVDEVVAVLPGWAHFYKSLTVDTDRKVRENAQACHGAVVGACGRQTAPHLKQLLPAWLQALHDDHVPAQTLARNSLEKTFPENKLPEVLSYCKSEIVTYLLDSITGNPELVSNNKTDNADGAEEKTFQYYRLVTSSLLALEYFSQNLPAQHDNWYWTELNPLLSNSVFWNFSTSSVDQIRAAWFAVTGRLIERFSSTFGETYGTKTMRVLLGAAKETNAVVTANMWACLLQLMHSAQDWHKYLDKKELLIKRILDVLESGGWGDARHLSTMLLPLLAHLPPDIFQKEFYQSFFNGIFAGLKQKNIWSSKSERQSWIASLAECLRYLSIQQYDFVVEVVTSVHRTWILEVFSASHNSQTRTNLIKCSAINMASLVKYWLKQSSEQNSEKYEQLIRNFWQNIGSATAAQIDKLPTSNEEKTQLVEHHVVMFQTLKASLAEDSKKRQCIKFSVDSEAPVKRSCEPVQQWDASVCDRYKHNLHELVQLICIKYFEVAQGSRVCEPLISPLVGLLSEFNEEKLFLGIAEHFHVTTLYHLYRNVLRDWFLDDAMKCKAMVDVVFLLLGHMDEEQQESTMHTFQQLPSDVREWCVRACVMRPHRTRPAVQRWARTDAVRDTLTDLCSRLVTTGSAAHRGLLLACLINDHNNEDMLIGAEAVCSVLQLACDALEDARSATLEQCALLGGELVAALPCAAPLLHAHCRRLLLRLFLVTHHVPRGDLRLSPETWRAVCCSWQNGIASLEKEQRLDFLLQLANTIKQLLIDNVQELNLKEIENMASLCPYLLSKDSNPPEDMQLASTFTHKLLELDVESLEPFALHHDCIFANLNCHYENYAPLKSVLDDQHREMHKADVVKYLNGLLFRCMYLKMVLLHDADEEGDSSWCEPMVADENILLEFCKVVHDYSILCSLCEGYGFWRHYHILRECKETMDVQLTQLIVSSLASKDVLLHKLVDLGVTTGYYWCYARKHFETLGNCEYEREESMDFDNSLNPITGNGIYHSLQAMTRTCNEVDEVHRAKFLLMVRSLSLAHGSHMEPALVRELVAAQRTRDITAVANAYFGNQTTMLFETDVTEASLSHVVSNGAVLDFLTHLVSYKGWTAPAHWWDFTTVTLCSVISSMEKSKHKWDSLKMGILARAASRLYCAVSKFIASVPQESTRRQPGAHLLRLPAEWRDVFAPDLHLHLFGILLHVLDSDAEQMNSNRAAVLEGLLRCAERMSWSSLPRVRQDEPGALHAVLEVCARCLRQGRHPGYQFLAHAALRIISEPLMLRDAKSLKAWSERAGEHAGEYAGEQVDERVQCERPKLSIEYLEEAYTQLQETALGDLAAVHYYELEEDEQDWPPEQQCMGTWDRRSAWWAWFLTADALHALCSRARDDLQQQLMQVYRARGYAEPLVSGALHLLPRRLQQHALENTTPPPHHYDAYFLETARTSVYQLSAELVRRLACRCLWWTVSTGGGAGARGWLAGAPPRAARLLTYLVRGYVSPHLVRYQLTHLQRYAKQLENAEVTIRWSSLEVSCEFPIEERHIELRVWFAQDHPLGLPRVAGPSPSGPAVNTNWIVLYLAYQNGMLLTALQMWMQAINSRFESAAQCFICYCRLESNSGRLPRLRCHQCNNKFHHACLRKWFNTSKKSNCPLCRSPF